jgi:uncharacterized protein with PIN domain
MSAEDIARDVLRAFFDTPGGFEDMSHGGRARAVEAAALRTSDTAEIARLRDIVTMFAYNKTDATKCGSCNRKLADCDANEAFPCIGPRCRRALTATTRGPV